MDTFLLCFIKRSFSVAPFTVSRILLTLGTSGSWRPAGRNTMRRTQDCQPRAPALFGLLLSVQNEQRVFDRLCSARTKSRQLAAGVVVARSFSVWFCWKLN